MATSRAKRGIVMDVHMGRVNFLAGVAGVGGALVAGNYDDGLMIGYYSFIIS